MDDWHGHRVMVIDDDPLMLKLMGHILSTLGFREITALGSGHEGLQVIGNASAQPNLILLDLNMPVMDGIEFIRKLVEHDFSGALIVVSGEDLRILETVEKLASGHDFTVLGHLQKPVSKKNLESLLSTWIPAIATDRRTSSRRSYDAQELKAGLANRELVAHYQPKVAVSSGEPVGVEALARWGHPSDGLVYPDQFIGVAEEHGLIDALTLGMLDIAMADVGRWQRAGMSSRVAVNVSMDNLNSLDFPDQMSELTARAGVEPSKMILEITESRLMQNLQSVLDILTRLRLKRFDLAIDDFGTGHSSLAQLRDMPFNQLKIDQGFVRGAHCDKTKQAIYSASVNMAKELGMEIVAEGVETLADWNFLRSTGCDVAQGYFIAKPMPADALDDWANEWRHRVSRDFDGETAD